MSELGRRALPARRALGWLAVPLAFLGLALWAEGGGRPDAERGLEFLRGQALTDAKLRRTLARFSAAGPLEELAPVGAEGLDVALQVDPDELLLMRIPGNRARFKERDVDAVLQLGDGPALPATLSLRGESSLWHGERLNFEVDLLQPQPFEAGLEMEQLFLMAMNEDPHQIAEHFALRVYADLGLYPTHFQYARLALNGAPGGVYLLLEPPRRGLRRLHPDLVAVHRRMGRRRYRTYWARDVPAVSASLDRLRALRHRQPADAEAALREVLDLDAYYRYLAVNSLLRNADTQDELFLFERRADPARPEPLEPMAWDPDSIDARGAKPDTSGDPLIFSGRDALDFRTAADPGLRALYARTLSALLRERLTAEYLGETLRSSLAAREALDAEPANPEQRAVREARRRYAAELEARLLARRAELLRLAAGGPA